MQNICLCVCTCSFGCVEECMWVGVYEETWRPEPEVGCPLKTLSAQFLLKAKVL